MDDRMNDNAKGRYSLPVFDRNHFSGVIGNTYTSNQR